MGTLGVSRGSLGVFEDTWGVPEEVWGSQGLRSRVLEGSVHGFGGIWGSLGVVWGCLEEFGGV